MKNIIFAMPAAAPAIPPKPNTAAIIAITKNVIVQRNIVFSLVINLLNNTNASYMPKRKVDLNQFVMIFNGVE